MSKLSLKLQTRSLAEMSNRKPYIKQLAGLKYEVLPKVYKGSTDTELICSVLDIKKNQSVWDIGTGTGLIALTAKKRGAGYVLATDLNPDAVKNAKRNSKILSIKIDVKKADVFGKINKKFDLITFNPPFTNHPAKKSHEISFWDIRHKTTEKFFRNIKNHLNKNGKAFIYWSSFAKISTLNKIAKTYNLSLTELARKKGRNDFTYYVFTILY